MNKYNIDEQVNTAEMVDENDSFHSFPQSDSDSLESLYDIDDMTIIDKPKYDLARDATIKLNLDDIPKLSPLPKSSIKNHYMVHRTTPYTKMPDAELFDMNVQFSTKLKPKNPLDTSPDSVAMQKFAFTETWVEEQQKNQARKRSLSRDFTTALDNYFKEDNSDQFANLSLQKQQRDEINQGLFVETSKSSSAPSASFKSITENGSYISPFEDMPKVPKTKPIPGLKPYVLVPAGFDLTNLVEYKNSNHWHRRPTTRNQDSP